MSDLKITIDQLKNYLGTGLKVSLENFPLGYHERIFELDCGHDFHMYLQNNWVKPICYRLPDLDKFIPELGFVPLQQIWKLDLGHKDWISKEREDLIQRRGFNHWINQIPYGIIQKLFGWHFWPFGEEYFEAGLVIDKLKEVKDV